MTFRSSVSSIHRGRHFILPVVALCLIAGCGEAPDLETSRRFQSAEESFSSAQSTADFARAAGQYDEILAGGFVSGTVLYNQGNAWMRAGNKGRAIASYRQAKRFRPRDPYLDANLRNALNETATAESEPSAIDYVFFWHNWLSYHEKFLLTTMTLAAVLSLIIVAQLGVQRSLFRRLAFAGGAFLLLAMISTARDWHSIEQTTHGVVVVDECTARKGNSKNYKPAFTQPLNEGTEFTVIERRGDWLHVSLDQSGEGWLLARDVVTY